MSDRIDAALDRVWRAAVDASRSADLGSDEVRERYRAGVFAKARAALAPAAADGALVERVARILVAIEGNYQREGSGPGSRFAGQRLEIVQARAVLREVLGPAR